MVHNQTCSVGTGALQQRYLDDINLFPNLCNNTFKRAHNPRLRNNQMTYELYSTFIFSVNFVDLLCSFLVRRIWDDDIKMDLKGGGWGGGGHGLDRSCPG